MKKSILTTLAAFLIVAGLAPYFIGLFNHQSVIITVQNYTDATDGDIEGVLRCYYFYNVGVFDAPGFTDYYNSGFASIANYETFRN